MAATGSSVRRSSTDPGVSAKSVKLGYIFSETGSAGSTFKNAGKALQGAHRPPPTPRAASTAARSRSSTSTTSRRRNLTGRRTSCRTATCSRSSTTRSFAFLAYRYLLGAGVPMVGGGYDGTYYGQKGNETMLSALGNATPFNGLRYDNVTKVMKQLGGKKSAAIGYGASPSSTASAKTTQTTRRRRRASRPSTPTPRSTSAAPTSDRSSSASRTRAPTRVYLPLVASTDFAILQGLQQNGVKMKAILMPTGYGQDLLDSPIVPDIGPNTVLFQTYKPVEIGDKATKQFQSDLKKAGINGVPDYGDYTGYISCDLAVTALEQAGKTPDPQGLRRRLPQPAAPGTRRASPASP